MNMKRSMKFLATEFRDRKDYFRGGKDEISTVNQNVLLAANVAMLILLILFLLLAPVLIRGWKPSVYHISFLPVSLLCCIVTFLYWLGRKRGGRDHTQLLCVMFAVILFAFCILIDTAGTPDGPGTFTPSSVPSLH